ncbi:VWA domain-containing protein [Stutzerimonas zhaodongensis]|uniref:vWA domain-containing protein n=1 Tax=Stutzerimonas zhaodongensis TaxID=1176257 RepID=UPI0039EFDBFD
MTEWLPHLLRPFWLLVLPLPIWLLWRLWHRQRQIGRWQRLLPEAFHSLLLTRGKLRNSRRPWLLLCMAWLVAALALLGPSWQLVEQPSQSRADPLVVLLETTPAMLATDARPNRLEQAKRKVLDLLQARQDAQTAVVAFAGSAHTLVPLTNDVDTTRNLLDALQPDLMPEAGHRADLAVSHGIELLQRGANGRGRLLLIGSSLTADERSAIRTLLEAEGHPLLIMGVGTAEGAPIAREDGSFLKDDSGAILIPRLDDASLRRFASSIQGRYQRARIDDTDLRNLGLLKSSGELITQDDSTRLDSRLDQGHWLLLPLLLLAALAGRRGWLFCLPLLVALPQPASAVSMEDLWRRGDQQGIRLLEAQRPAEAAERFDNARWRGYAHYLAGNFDQAAEQFAKGDTAADHYNRGNALARTEELEAAIEAYEQALELDPDLEPAQRNKAIVEDILRQRKQQAGQESQSDEPEAQDAPTDAKPSESHAASNDSAAEQQQDPEASSQQEPMADENASAQMPAAVDDEQQPETEDTGSLPQEAAFDPEQDQAMNQWLRKIPDNPGELLRRKFLYEQRKRQELNR